MESYKDDRNDLYEKYHEIDEESERLLKSIDRMRTDYYSLSQLVERSPHFREELGENGSSDIISTLDSMFSTVQTVGEEFKGRLKKEEKDLNEDEAVYLDGRKKKPRLSFK